MKFKNLEELVKYIVSEPINLLYTEVDFKPLDKKEEKEKSIKESGQVSFNMLYDSPVLEAVMAEENIMFVESVEGHKNFCGSGKIKAFGREFSIDLCEFEDEAFVTMDINIDGILKENVQFKLKPMTEETKDKVYVRKDILNE